MEVENIIPYDQDQVFMELRADKELYCLYYSKDNKVFHLAGKGEVAYLTTEVGGVFTGNYIGLYASGNGSKCTSPAHFDWFEYHY